MKLKFAVIGGDRRAVHLAELLQREGRRVSAFALERAALPEEIARAEHLQAALYGADAVVLPLPAEKGGLLNAPYARLPCEVRELTETVWPGQIVFGGLFTEDWRLWALKSGVQLVDWMRCPSFVTGNAALTAEGAVGLLLQESERSLAGSRVLLGGYGRIGRVLAQRLRGMGASVTVAARREESRAEAAALGFAADDFSFAPGANGLSAADDFSCAPGANGSSAADGLCAAGAYDFVVNTVPARVFGEELLCCLPETALLLELASPPGGFDRNLAENLGLRVMAAPGLPGRSAPRTAAELMLREIERTMKEERE